MGMSYPLRLVSEHLNACPLFSAGDEDRRARYPKSEGVVTSGGRRKNSDLEHRNCKAYQKSSNMASAAYCYLSCVAYRSVNAYNIAPP